MGHKAGWLTLHAGIASGADVIVIPEILMTRRPLRLPSSNAPRSKRFSIVAVAEGAISREEAAMSKRTSRPPGRPCRIRPFPTAWQMSCRRSQVRKSA
ncbi:MAG: 6-phosphofructokinase [Oscillospiraceae bacterium]